MTVNTRMLLGEELKARLKVAPEYCPSVRNLKPEERLLKLNDLYDVYLPSAMSQEIYCKLFTTLMKSLKQKNGVNAIRQSYENIKLIRRQQYRGLLGGADAFTVIGVSGMGKSSSISRAIAVIEEQINADDILPFVVVQCPFDSSAKGLLLEILRVVDMELGTDYNRIAKRKNATTDVLIGMVSQVCLNSVGILIVDEIQNVVNAKNGKIIVGMLTQLINTSGIGICMVGTPECTVFFEQTMPLARRSLGLSYDKWEYGKTFCEFCHDILEYQYVRNPMENSEENLFWLYEHSGGVPSIVVSLLHDAQEIAILSGHEKLDKQMFEEAYQQRLSLLHAFVHPDPVVKSSGKKKKKERVIVEERVKGQENPEIRLMEIRNDEGFWETIQQIIQIEEVVV